MAAETRDLKGRLIALLAQLEEECAQAEVALRARNWEALGESMGHQRRTRQAIVNELAAARCDVHAVPEIVDRLQAIFTFRNDQLRRLTAYRAEVSGRLQITRKWKDAARSARRGIGPAPVFISRMQ
jgi:PAS domain-containing protein